MTNTELNDLDHRIEARLEAFEAKLLRTLYRTAVGVLSLLITGIVAFTVVQSRVSEHERRITEIEATGSAPMRVSIAEIQATLRNNAQTLNEVRADIAEMNRRRVVP